MRDSPCRLGLPGVVGLDQATYVIMDWVRDRIRVVGERRAVMGSHDQCL